MSAPFYPRVYHPELADYLQARVKVQPNGCWEWQRACFKAGYGSAGTGRFGTRYAHRLAFLCAIGDLPPKPYVIRHRCDNPRCCRPTHLAGGTSEENVRDAVERGRCPRGEQVGNAKLTEDAVRAIRATKGRLKALALRFRVSPQTIHDVRRGRTWAHVEP